MKCKCGYEGLIEIGKFPDERWGGKYVKYIYFLHLRSLNGFNVSFILE